ncbi:cytochrome c oxidase subunit 3 [Nocardia sp. NPDC057663]|uniref:cytochrome c oxidase subunit 3 n=1 Tax=Nocardia sp. NPDC057663 TaxID=3346201 RepID=UPI003671683B
MTVAEPAAEAEFPGFVWYTDEPDTAVPDSEPSGDGGAPGELGLWVFILGDMTLFGAFFIVFVWENRNDRPTFAASAEHLHQSIGAVNTLVLLLSSYLVVIALHAQRRGSASLARAMLAGVVACALVFAALKAVEYSMAITSGHVVTTNMFWTFYFVLTGIHLVHVLVGAVMVTFWRRQCRGDHDASGARPFSEVAAVYWHMVDLLWVVIFTLLYLGCLA